MIVLIFALGIMSSYGASMCYKMGSSRLKDRVYAPALLCSIYMTIAAVAYGIIMLVNGTPHFSPLTAAFAAMSGISLALAAVFYLLAMQCGPYTTSAAIINFSTFLPILYCAIFLHEEVSLRQFICLLCLLAVIFVIIFSNRKKDDPNKAGKKWAVMISAVLLFNGLINFGVRCQAKFVGGEQNENLFLYFLFAAATAFVIFLCCGGRRATFAEFRTMTVPALGLSVALGVNMMVNSVLPRLNVSSAIHYPVIYVGSMMLSTISGAVLFRDKIKPITYIALVIGVVLVILISV